MTTESRKEANRRYAKTQKAKERYKRFWRSEKGKLADRRYKERHREELRLRAREYQQRDDIKVKQAAYRKTEACKLIRRKYEQSEKGKVTHKKKDAKRRQHFPEKVRAHNALNNAIQAGIMMRQLCSKCGAANAEGHHPDYSKPLEVVWLCGDCHRNVHKEIVNDKCN